jgi:hypothetical protein
LEKSVLLMAKTMGKTKNIVIGIVLALSLAFGFTVTASDNFSDTAGCYGSYTSGATGETLMCP